MNRDQLTLLLADAASVDAERSPDCPDEHQIAGYVDGGLHGAGREQFERHLADCGFCLGLVGLLSRERNAGADEAVRSEPAPAPGSATTSARRRWWLAPQWAVAATLVLAIPLLLQTGRSPEPDNGGPAGPESAATRALPLDATELRVLTPGAGSAVAVQGLSFRWTAVAGTPYYDVRIVTEDGEVVIQQRVSDTNWQPPSQIELQPGAEYFVHVDAYPLGDKAVSSDHVPFRVVE